MTAPLKTLAFLLVAWTCAASTLAQPGPANPIDACLLLDDEGALGFGHAALLLGDDEQGWAYFSFGPRTGTTDVLHQLWFPTLDVARASADLARYDRYLLWTGGDRDAAAIARARADCLWAAAPYDVLTHNCFHMSADVIAAAGFRIDPQFILPPDAFAANIFNAQSHGDWPHAPR